jgi:hypothetical protein
MAYYKGRSKVRTDKFMLSPLEALVLLHHIVYMDYASNDADRTVQEIIEGIDSLDGLISKGLLESALYCCNMAHEDSKFWHPLNWSFESFISELLPGHMEFNKDYNVLFDKRKE